MASYERVLSRDAFSCASNRFVLVASWGMKEVRAMVEKEVRWLLRWFRWRRVGQLRCPLSPGGVMRRKVNWLGAGTGDGGWLLSQPLVRGLQFAGLAGCSGQKNPGRISGPSH